MCSFRDILLFVVETWFLRLKTCVFVQLGVGHYGSISTPVAVAGLSSGVAMVAAGSVRLPAPAAQLMLVCESGHCVFD